MTADDAPSGPAGHGEVFLDVQALVDFFEQRPQYALVMEGPDMRVVAVNRALRDFLPGRQVLGRPYLEVVSEILHQGFDLVFAGVYETGAPALGHEWQIHFQHPDGSNTVMWCSYSILPRRGADGRVVGIWGEASDVTPEVLARKALHDEMRTLTQQYEQARAAIDTLQRALLPDRVPVLPTLDVAARYLLAADELAAGGDWFDVLAHEGHALLVVGDVVGHGVAAAAAMGQLRAVLLDRLVTEPTVAEAIAALDRRAARDPGSFGATVCVVDLDLATGDLVYVTAGHPPPLVLDGPTPEAGRYLEPTGAGPLGRSGEISAGHDRLDDGDIVVLYTDGLVELPGRNPAEGTVDLARAARRAASNTLLPVDAPELAAERIAGQVIESLTRVAGYDDDVTVVAAQRRAGPAPFHLRLVANEHAAVVTREAVRGWLRERAIRIDDLDVVLHAVTELVDNVADHAYDRHGGPLDVAGALHDDGTLGLVVRDEGRWEGRPWPPGPGRGGRESGGRGRGLALIRGTVDHLDIDTGDGGTTVTVRHGVARGAGMLETGVRARPVEEPDVEVWEHATDATDAGVTVGARGALDARAVPKLRAHLVAATAPGGPPATLDLREVTLLASAAVHLLLQILARGDLRIVAPAGSVAQHVLRLSAIPHTTAPDGAPPAGQGS
jgi:serine phosphatase RsbU (regulator of sigma subunit)/anti-sigma regulatory factor (Ser/Thr protein kinase)/anti-anti-sigma regulatory factor